MSRSTRGPIVSGPTTALIYTRVSSDEQAREGVSLDAQLRECRHYAARMGWTIGPEFTDVMSGTRDDRPQYQRLMIEVRAMRSQGQPVAVVVAALDRFGRRVAERVRAREELASLNVEAHSVREGGKVPDLVWDVLAAVAQEEVRRLGERVRAARHHLRTRGWKAPGEAAFGYLLRPSTDDERKLGAPKSVLDIDPDRALIVRELFTRAADGETTYSLARWISSLPSDVRRGQPWGSSTVRSRISARVYVGQFTDGTPGNWPALIELDTFDRVQARIAEHAHMPNQAHGKALLTGLTRCVCGARMSASQGGDVHPPVLRYRCYGHALGAGHPRCHRTVPRAPIDSEVAGAVSALLEKLTSQDQAIKTALERAWKALSRPASDSPTRVRTLEQAAEKARTRIRRLVLLFADGEIDREGYDLGRGQAQSDLDAAEVELARLGQQSSATPALPPLVQVLKSAGNWNAVLTDGSVERQREVLGVLIDQVVAARTGSRQYEARIEWTALGTQLRGIVAAAEHEGHAA
jgi:site-specific DNA recombinase